jgi:hypothetical protein
MNSFCTKIPVLRSVPSGWNVTGKGAPVLKKASASRVWKELCEP